MSKTKKVLRYIKIGSFVLLFMFIASILAIHFFIQEWAETDEGTLPAKTAVVLHAINNNIVSLEMKLPNFISKQGTPTIVTEDVQIPVSDGSQINARIYRPNKEGTFPITLYFHGGAFLNGFGSIETHANIMRATALRTQSVVIGVGYRVAPDHIFPTAIEDSYEALLWASENASSFQGNASQIAVMGDSAGGNIATVVAAMSRDRKGPELSAQVLLYPLTTFLDEEFESRGLYDSGYYLLSRHVMMMARDHYTPDPSMWMSPYSSPLISNHLKDLPPTIIITAEFDPLRDEGEEYANRLFQNDVPVQTIRYNGMMHGFVSFYEVMHGADHALNKTSHFLKESFKNQIYKESFDIKVINFKDEDKYLRDKAEAYAFAGFLLFTELKNRMQKSIAAPFSIISGFILSGESKSTTI